VDIGFPVGTVERFNLKLIQHVSIQTAQVDIYPIRVRSGTVKGVNPTNPTEQVFGNARVEGIGRQHLLAGQQGKLIGGDNQVQKSFLAADRAVAVLDGAIACPYPHLKSDCPAVTATLIN